VVETPIPADATGHEAKLKHLEFLQAVIARMSNSSFLFKGWAVTVAAALTAFAGTTDKGPLRVALVGAVLSSLLFWGLDGYYLWIERRYRELYNDVAAATPAEIDFSMQTDRSKPVVGWLSSCVRPHLLFLYVSLVVAEALGLLLLKGD
jgi:hypothetical protein